MDFSGLGWQEIAGLAVDECPIRPSGDAFDPAQSFRHGLQVDGNIALQEQGRVEVGRHCTGDLHRLALGAANPEQTVQVLSLILGGQEVFHRSLLDAQRLQPEKLDHGFIAFMVGGDNLVAINTSLHQPMLVEFDLKFLPLRVMPVGPQDFVTGIAGDFADCDAMQIWAVANDDDMGGFNALE